MKEFNSQPTFVFQDSFNLFIGYDTVTKVLIASQNKNLFFGTGDIEAKEVTEVTEQCRYLHTRQQQATFQQLVLVAEDSEH